jgi:hypothetical protein
MPTQIVVEFDPKDASPLEIINTLDKIMQQNLEEGKITDYSIAEEHMDEDSVRMVGHTLVLRNAKPQDEPQQPTTPQENPT